MARRTGQSKQLRLRIAHEAARLIAEHGIGDYLLAKRKAAAALGVDDRGALPRNTEIEAALKETQRLFGGREHDDALAGMRRSAVMAMTELASFAPRAVGAVVSGAMTINSVIELHLFSDPAEAVGMDLYERGLDHEVAQTRLRTVRDQYDVYPACHFELDGFAVEATVFPLVGLRQAPLSRVDGRPMKRLGAEALMALIERPPGAPQRP